MNQKTKEINAPTNLSNTELGALEIFKHSECRKATIAMFIIWMSVNLSKIMKHEKMKR